MRTPMDMSSNVKRGSFILALLGAVTLWVVTSGSAGAQPAGTAEMRLNVPPGPQPLRTPFQVTIELVSISGTWAGYQTYVAYDADLVEVVEITPGGIANCDTDATWGNPSVPPYIQTGCAFQESTEVGTVEVITMQCLKDGRAPLRFISHEVDPGAGTFFFDENAVYFDTKVVDGEVMCGAGGPASDVPLPTPFPTPDLSGVAGTSGQAPGQAGAGSTPAPQAGQAQGATSSPRSGEGNGRFVTSLEFVAPAAAFAALAVIGLAFGLRRRQRREHQ